MAAKSGFTLEELLICLTILAVISTFTIPKVLQSQQTAKNNALVKEVAGAIAGQYQIMQVKGQISANSTGYDILQQMNFVSSSTSGSRILDSYQTGPTVSCAAPAGCIFLTSGVGIRGGQQPFNGTAPTDSVGFMIDPDGRVTDGTTNGPGKSVALYLTYDGRIMTLGAPIPGTRYGGALITGDPSNDPPYFQW